MEENETYRYEYIPWNASNYSDLICDSQINPIRSPYFQGTVYVMYSIIFVVAMIGNGIICYIVVSSPRMRSVTNYFIMNLAVGDILITIFCVPFTSVSYLQQFWSFGAFLCPVVNYSQAVSVFVSAYTMVAISVDRYTAIMWPLRPRLSKKLTALIIFIVWMIAAMTGLPIPIFSRLGQPNEWYEMCDSSVAPISKPSDEQVLSNEWMDISIDTEINSSFAEENRKETVSDADEEMGMESVEELYIETHVPTENNSFTLAGRRIVDIQYLFQQVQAISHPGLDCNVTNLDIISESRLGLRSILTLKCKMCGIVEKVSTENPNAGSNVNMLAVSGALSVGIGYSQTNELLSAMDIPCMADTTYQKYFEKLSTEIKSAAWEKIDAAAKEEAELAKAAGEVNEDGIPIITVIADGAWSKRSYRTNYNAASGVACVIGAKTKKILFLGIRNKYCTVCAKEAYYKNKVPDHVCYKNWTSSSTAMESDILLEAFKCSIDMHGLIYGRLIGDGDSNVYSKLISASPYGPAFHIGKVECKNHLLRNYMSKLSDLKSNTAYNIRARKMVSEKIEKLRLAVSGAVHYWCKSEADFKEKIINLKSDILNGPHHVFGDHGMCRDYFCDEEKRKAKTEAGEENQIPYLKETNIYEEVMKRTGRIANNSWSLLHNMDNNLAESYNRVLAHEKNPDKLGII